MGPSKSLNKTEGGVFNTSRNCRWIWSPRRRGESAPPRAAELALVPEGSDPPRPSPHTPQQADFFSSGFIVTYKV